MKNSRVLGHNFYEYVKNNANADPKHLYLAVKGKNFDFPVEFAVTQIECRKKTGRKLSAFIDNEQFLFPSAQASEQSTHQRVASYHASLIGKGKSVIDMTAGLGIDAFTIAKNGNSVTAVELAPERAEILRHNADILDIKEIEIIEGDSIEWISKNNDRKFDILFVDPARRTSDNRRTYFFRDCLPDIVSNINSLKSCSRLLMVKASPILDIRQILRELEDVASIHIVCYKGECKEILVVIDSSAPTDDPEIITVDLSDDTADKSGNTDIWQVMLSELGNKCPIAGQTDLTAGAYLYDPNAAVHKLNCASELCRRFPGMKKLSANTDLYVSNTHHKSFPGRIFMINEIPDKTKLKQIRNERFEVAVRNYPLSADDLRKKLKVAQGSDNFIFGCAVGEKNKPTLLLCRKLVRNLL